MIVERMSNGRGSHIEPRLDSKWALLTQLEWHAAVAEADGAPTIKVHESEYRINGKLVPDSFNVMVGRVSSGPHSFHSAWSYINGVSVGARESRA